MPERRGLHIQVDRDRRFILSGWGCNGGKGISAAGNCTTEKKVGMKTAEMYQIAESRGVDEQRAETESAI
jgi:hypothetical protein